MANKLVIRLVMLFLLAQLIGIVILSQYIDFKATASTGITTTNAENYVVEPPQIENENYSFIAIGLAIIIGTALILIIIKYNAMLIWKLWFFMSICIALFYAFYPFLKIITPTENIALSVTILITVILGFFKIFRPTYIAHTISELFIYGGLAALFVPIINLTSAAILLILLAGYDYYMVNKSGHMVTLAKASMQSQMIAGIYVGTPTTSDEENASEQISHNRKHTKLSEIDNKNEAPTSSVMVGGGDIAFPLFFAGAVMKYSGSLISGLIVALGATAGLIVLFSISKRGKFYPAIPFVAAGSFIALGIVYLLI